MRAILPGRPQSKRQALCTAHWDGLRLVTYISGNAAVILGGPQTILQTIYVDTVEGLTAITLDESTGRIALCDAKNVYIYAPTGRDEGVLRWSQVHELDHRVDLEVTSLSWGSNDELLIGGSKLVLWLVSDHNDPVVLWDQKVAYPTALAYLSPDSSFVASVGQHDRLVKIWRRLSYEVDGTRFDVSYLPHPTTVTNLHWRKPWHTEQNLDSLLYTFCSDNHVRAWTTGDPHGLTILHQVGDIDMNASIQPRRLSVNSVSTKRYAFILDSRDFSTATEKAVQGSTSKNDHALEHLIEIANRSPEVCVVLDGLGHMSVWGLENVGYKTKLPPSVFHISHVDGMNISVPLLNDFQEDYVQFCIFAGGVTPSSISVLMHSYAGDIDWYDSQITRLFDTATRKDRAQLVSSLAGPGASVQKLVRNIAGNVVLSIAEDGHASIWKHGVESSTAPMLRRSTFNVEADIIDGVILSRGRYAAILTTHNLELWDIQQARAKKLATYKLELKSRVLRITQSRVATLRMSTSRVLLGYRADNSVEAWQISLPADSMNGVNGHHELLRSLGAVDLHAQSRYNTLLSVCNTIPSVGQGNSGLLPSSAPCAAVLAKEDILEIVGVAEEADSNKPQFLFGYSFETGVESPSAISATNRGRVALVNHDNTQLSIWDAIAGCWEHRLALDSIDPVKTIAWGVSPLGTAQLAICFDYHILILGEERYVQGGCRLTWVELQHIRIRDFTTHSIGDVCWLASGDLVVGSGIQLFVFEAERDNHIQEGLKSTGGVRSESESVAKPVHRSLRATVLPVFHPAVQSLLTSNYGIRASKAVLSQLHNQLKYFSEGDKLASYLDLDVERIIASHPSQGSSKTLIHNTNGENNGEANQADLSNYADSLCENLEKQRLWQISESEQSQLISQVRACTKLEEQEQSIDENGQRYLQGLYSATDEVPWSAIVFASLSTSQEVLVDLIIRHYGGKLTWDAARRSGLFYWLADVETVRQQLEIVGRAEFTKGEDRNPIDCSLYYLALKKKTVLIGLWRMSIGIREKDNTMKLLANNFNEPRWKASALKNAYALLSRRRFHYAAAFFLLGDSLWDAINVCAHQLQDLQLAVAIARAYEGDSQAAALTRLMNQVILPLTVKSEQGRWMASWAYSCILDRKDLAIQVLLRPVHNAVGVSLPDDEHQSNNPPGSLNYAVNDPLLSLLYIHLRGQFTKQNKWRGIIYSKAEWDFVLRCARHYARMGCDILAVSLLRNWQFVTESPEPRATNGTAVSDAALQRRKILYDLDKAEDEENKVKTMVAEKRKPPPTQFVEPSANSLLDSFGF